MCEGSIEPGWRWDRPSPKLPTIHCWEWTGVVISQALRWWIRIQAAPSHCPLWVCEGQIFSRSVPRRPHLLIPMGARWHAEDLLSKYYIWCLPAIGMQQWLSMTIKLLTVDKLWAWRDLKLIYLSRLPERSGQRKAFANAPTFGVVFTK